MYISREQLTAMPAEEFTKLMAYVDEDTEDLLYLLLHDLLIESAVEIPDEIYYCVCDV